eukprot:g1836.t1
MLLMLSGVFMMVEVNGLSTLRASRGREANSMSPEAKDAIVNSLDNLSDDARISVMVDGKESNRASMTALSADVSHEISIRSFPEGSDDAGTARFDGSSQCPVSTDLTDPTPATMTFCKEYESSACCSVKEDREVQMIVKSLQDRILTAQCPGCVANMKKLLCAVRCSSEQKLFADILLEETVAEIRLCSTSCNALTSSCTSVTQKFHSATSFCGSVGNLDVGHPAGGLGMRFRVLGEDSNEDCLDIDLTSECQPGVTNDDDNETPFGGNAPTDEKDTVLVLADPVPGAVADEEGESNAKEDTDSDGTWITIYLGVLGLVLVISALAFLAYRNKKTSSERKELLQTLCATGKVRRFLYIGGDNEASGYYAQDDRIDDDDGATKTSDSAPTKKVWRWISPVVSVASKQEAYAKAADPKAPQFRLVEGVQLDKKNIVEGPAEVMLQMRKITNLSPTYTSSIEAYGQVYVGSETEGASGKKYRSNSLSFVRFIPEGVYKHGWSFISDPSRRVLEWESDPKKVSEIDVHFQVRDVKDAYVRVVARDRQCEDRYKSFCEFDKEMIGVTERIHLKSGGGDLVRPLAPYFVFDDNDKITDASLGTKLHMHVEISQSGFVVQSLAKNGAYVSKHCIPTTPAFCAPSWTLMGDDSAKGASLSMTMPQELMKLCDVHVVGVDHPLTLAACVRTGEVAGIQLEPLKSKSGDDSESNCVCLFCERDGGGEGVALDSSVASVKTHKMSATEADITILWKSGGKATKIKLFVRISEANGTIGIYENGDSEDSIIGQIELTGNGACKFLPPGAKPKRVASEIPTVPEGSLPL